MSQKQGSSKKKRNPKTSKGKHGGGGKVELTPLQKVLFVNGGIGHYLRPGQHRVDADKTKAGREAIARAKESADKAKLAKRQQKAALEGTHKIKHAS